MLSVVAVGEERVPRLVLKLICSLAAGFPSRVMRVVIEEVIVAEFTRIVFGEAETVTVAGAMFTVAVCEIPCHVAVMVAFPAMFPGIRVT